MKTTAYNPSLLEVEVASAIEKLKDQITGELSAFKIESIEHQLDMDNPILHIHVRDQDEDPHILVLKLIQKPDNTI